MRSRLAWSALLLTSLPSSALADCVQGDCANGYGWWEWGNGDRYYGFFKKQRRHGLGAFYSESGSKYEGAWLNDTKDGHGTWTWSDGTRYTGKWRQDLHHGHGIYLFSGGEMYEGDYHLGKRHGRGINTWPSGDRYEGDFDLDKRRGRGRLVSTSGSVYEGDWRADKIDGSGSWSWQNGNVYQGSWVNGERSGLGCYAFWDGTAHLGTWLSSKEHGAGVRLQVGLWGWGNRTVRGEWDQGKLVAQEQIAVGGGAGSNEAYSSPTDLFARVSNALWETREGQRQAQETAGKAREAAVSARSAAREAMTLARAAQAISRAKSITPPGHSATAANAVPPPPPPPSSGLGSSGGGRLPSNTAYGSAGCVALGSLANGEIHPTLDFYQQGDMVSLSCDAGFQLSGGFPLRECDSNGKWTGGGRPQCSPTKASKAAARHSSSNALSARFPARFQVGAGSGGAWTALGLQLPINVLLSPATFLLSCIVGSGEKRGLLNGLKVSPQTNQGGEWSTAVSDALIGWVALEERRCQDDAAALSQNLNQNQQQQSGEKNEHKQQQQQQQQQQQEQQRGTRAGEANDETEGGGEGGREEEGEEPVARFLSRCSLGYLAMKVRDELRPSSLDRLLVLIAQHTAASPTMPASMWPRDQQRLLSCAQDYLLTNQSYGRG